VLTAVSPYLAEHLARVFRYRGPIHVVPNGLSPSVFAVGESRGEAPPEGGPRFASVLTGWTRVKNPRTLLLAFARVRAELPGATLTMYGPGFGPGEDAERWARAEGVAAGVEFAGIVRHPGLLERLAAGADVLVHPAVEESFSMAVAEAMALGLAVIGGERSGGVPSTLDGGRAGRLVDVTSPDALARAMVELGTDAGLRRRMGCVARRSARDRFSLAAVVAAYERIYETAGAG
jgi:L-malate glycosyltransferase